MLKPDATAVYVAASQAARAIEEAIEAEIPLVVAVAEHIPTIDLMRVRLLRTTYSPQHALTLRRLDPFSTPRPNLVWSVPIPQVSSQLWANVASDFSRCHVSNPVLLASLPAQAL